MELIYSDFNDFLYEEYCVCNCLIVIAWSALRHTILFIAFTCLSLDLFWLLTHDYDAKIKIFYQSLLFLMWTENLKIDVTVFLHPFLGGKCACLSASVFCSSSMLFPSQENIFLYCWLRYYIFCDLSISCLFLVLLSLGLPKLL